MALFARTCPLGQETADAVVEARSPPLDADPYPGPQWRAEITVPAVVPELQLGEAGGGTSRVVPHGFLCSPTIRYPSFKA